MRKKYCVFDGDILIFKGTREEVCEEFGIKKKGMYNYLRGQRLLRRKYVVLREGEKKPKTTNEQNLEYLYTHLKWYGNTTAYNFDPRPYTNELKEKGIFCDMRNLGDHYYIEVMA